MTQETRAIEATRVTKATRELEAGSIKGSSLVNIHTTLAQIMKTISMLCISEKNGISANEPILRHQLQQV